MGVNTTMYTALYACRYYSDGRDFPHPFDHHLCLLRHHGNPGGQENKKSGKKD